MDAAWDRGWRPPPDVSSPEDRPLYNCESSKEVFDISLEERVERWGASDLPEILDRVQLDFFSMSEFESDE